ncbi:hypothetical protein ACQP3D_29180, partial [Escherichia coli]
LSNAAAAPVSLSWTSLWNFVSHDLKIPSISYSKQKQKSIYCTDEFYSPMQKTAAAISSFQCFFPLLLHVI